ncbi:NlpC/P60 family protein [Actinomadura sp. 21ATH]|uniref:C40 family peptidase n=1 Tax=Actinomadura sp. 21ATH TaxID=1735444 RepID=UPI0035C09CFB
MKKLAFIKVAIGLFGCGGTLLVSLLVFAGLVIISTRGTGVLMACAPNDPSGGAGGVVQANAKKNPEDLPENYRRLYEKTGRVRNIPWHVLAGIGKIETNHGQATHLPGVSNGENYAGAGGPMQFLQASWNRYGDDWDLYWEEQRTRKNDPDGDGRKDRYDPADAILGASNHLRGSIGKMDSSINLSSADILNAIHRYNPGNYTPQSNPYVRDVLAAAKKYDNGDYKVGDPNYAGASACSGSMNLGSGSFGQKIAYAAAFWAEKKPGTPTPPSQNSKPTPYSWGGGTVEGPGYGIEQGAGIRGFDCSSLAQYAVFKASGGKIKIPRTTHAQWASNMGSKIVSRDQLAPGDLVFFRGVAHMGIYYGEVNNVRWMVEAPRTGLNVKFSKFDSSGSYVGAIRVKPPAGMENAPPSVFPAMIPLGNLVGAGAK